MLIHPFRPFQPNSNDPKSKNAKLYNQGIVYNFQLINSYPCDVISFRNSTKDVEQVDSIFSRLKKPQTDSSIIQEIDKLTTSNQKILFVGKFCQETGFPDLKKVSKLIEEHAADITKKAAEQSGSKVLYSGYNTTCSVGKNCALPGSDLDTWFTIIDGNQDDKHRFLGKIRELTNPLILSVTSSRTDDRPDAITKDEFLNSISIADDVFKCSDKMKNKIGLYNENLNILHNDWIKAGTFNIDLAQEIKHDWDKTPMVRAALSVEVMRDGKAFIKDFEKDDMQKIIKSCLYQFSNTQQMQKHKKTLKDKHLKRIEEADNFKTMSVQDKFDLVKSIIALTFKDKREELYMNNHQRHANLFKSDACGNMDQMFKYLLSKEHGGIDWVGE